MALVAIVCAVSPQHAVGATVGRDSTGTILRYDAAPGEANGLTVTKIGGDFYFADGLFQYTIGAGCFAYTTTTIRCTAAGVQQILINGGDMNDYLGGLVAGTNVHVTINGGIGNDTLEGGPMSDHLEGWHGNDVIIGGGGYDHIVGGNGFDTVDYTDDAGALAKGFVVVKVGQTGGDDDVREDVEKIVGSPGDDLIIGDRVSSDDTIDGDLIHGGGGNDTIITEGDGVQDTVDGGAGSDTCQADSPDFLTNCETLPNSPYGVVLDYEETVGGGGPPQLVGKGRAANFRWARYFIHWKQIEEAFGQASDPNRWNFHRDRIRELTEQGFSVLVVFNQIPPWAYQGGPPNQGAPCNDPEQAGTLNRVPYSQGLFFSFTYFAAQQLGDFVAAWEVWNEPDVCSHWRGSKQQYRDYILSPGYNGIVAARPNAIVGAPALANAATMNEFTNWLEEDSEFGSHLRVPISFISTHSFGYQSEVEDQMNRAESYVSTRGYFRNDSTGVVTFTLKQGYWITAFGFYTGGSGDVCGGARTVANPGQAYVNTMNSCWNRPWCKKTFYFQIGNTWYYDHYPNCDIPLLQANYTPKTRYYTIRDYITGRDLSK